MNAAAKERPRWGTPWPQQGANTLRSPTSIIHTTEILAVWSDKFANMSRRAYVEEGSEDDWNTLADPSFDPNSSDYGALESPARRGRRGRGSGGRRGRGEGSMAGGRGQHPQGDIVALTPRARGAVSKHA